MKFQTVLTGALLAFVAVSLAVAVADVAGLRDQPGSPFQKTEPEEGSDQQWIAYYFHTSTRCPTCRAIESHAQDAVHSQVESGALAWRVVNYEEAAHRHFASTFKLLCPSVVLVQMRAGEVVRWKNLERVWELNDERDAFLAYVQAELARFQEVGP